MENKGPAIMRVELADDKLPKFTEGKGSDDWVLFGERNDYPAHLIDLFNRSGKNNAIITGVSEMIKGDGWKVETPAAGLDLFLQNPNPFETADDILEKIALDFKLFGGFYLSCVWSKDGTKIIELYHVPFEEIRVNKEATKYFRCENWALGVMRNKVQTITAFNPKDATRGKTAQIFGYKQYRPGLKHYPLPDYIGCRQYVETDTEISNFHYNNIKHSFSNSTVISFFNGEPTLEEQRVLVSKLKGQKTGTDNAGGLVINFADRKDQAPEIVRLQPDEMDKQYLQLYTTVSDEIFTGHRITNSAIFGIKVPGQLGSRQDLIDSKEVFYMDYVKPKVQILERVWNYLLGWVTGGTVIIEKPNFKDSGGDISPTIPALPVAQSKQLTERDVLNMFASCGEPAHKYVVIKSHRLRFGEQDKELDTLQAFAFATPLNIEVSDSQKKVLSVIKENPLLNEAEIANLTKLSPKDVGKALTYLQDEGVIKISDSGFELTDAGLKTIDEQNLVTTEIFVKYKYTGPTDSRNRPFCSEMLSENKLFTRKEIDDVGTAAGYNVWAQRGGWYHNPSTEVNTPYCRHFWSQVIVKIKTR